LQELKACFESRDIELLQKTIAKMPVDQAKYHMKRCVDSGLWVPNEGENPLDKDETEAKGDDADKLEESTSESPKKSESSKEEPIYAGVSTEDVDWLSADWMQIK